MQPKYIISTIILFLSSFMFTQNLVINPSFEDYSSCPENPGEIGSALNWYSSSGTPDYFNICSSSNLFNVPINDLGYQFPFSGSAYAGFSTWSSSNPISPNKEIIRGSLSSPLIQGEKYYVSFYISAGTAYTNGPNRECYSNNICFQCDKYSYPVYQNSSTLIIDSIISDTLNWLHVTHSFVADTNYTRFFIGNWAVDSTIQYWQSPSATFCDSYYFLDNVCISTNPLGCNNSIGIVNYASEIKLKLFPNPSNGNFKLIGNNIQYIQVTNLLGVTIFEQEQVNVKEVDISIPNYKKGVHFVKVLQNGSYSTEKITFW